MPSFARRSQSAAVRSARTSAREGRDVAGEALLTEIGEPSVALLERAHEVRVGRPKRLLVVPLARRARRHGARGELRRSRRVPEPGRAHRLPTMSQSQPCRVGADLLRGSAGRIATWDVNSLNARLEKVWW